MEVYFETTRISVFAIDARDYTDLLKIYNDPANYQYGTGTTSHIALDELTSKIDGENKLDGFFFLIGKLKDSQLPCCYVKGQVKKGDMHSNLWISMLVTIESCRRQGYGTEFFHGLSKYYMETYSIKTIFISIHADNIEGQLFWKKVGFTESNHIIRQNVLLYNRTL